MTRAQKLAFKAFDRKRQVYQKKAAGIYKLALVESYRMAAEAVKAGEAHPTREEVNAAVKKGIRQSRPAWRKSYKLIYTLVGTDFAKATDKGLQKFVQKSFAQMEQKAKSAAQVVWEKAIAQYVAVEGGKRIVQIGATTNKRIMGALAEGFKAGEGADELAARIMGASKLLLPRANAIARTEIITASNLGSQIAAESFGVQLEKTWLGTDDERERATHQAADGQTVGLKDAFAVGNSLLMFPGDSSLGAEAAEVVNCRCTQTYRPV